ncbi:hypothetical protein [Arthrobacter sp. zg-Y769]|uniref:hypothetical protein n=1 Tax=Arthrobacter sp. zg-Y769 TaxID=2894191 RepID=UPI001E285C60|nr:hypothetical protein [Arthrobacter sp. zg-Y769]MCC9205965.1 hypothetical protein [Arthrobacter sp. zg-Y769]
MAPLIRKTAALVRGHRITVDLTAAQHIELVAVSSLQDSAHGRELDLRIECPDPLPECPALVPAGGVANR